MINFTYDKYALPRVESLVKAGVREAPHYAVPAEIIDALYSTKAIVDRSILTAAQEFGADKSLLRPTSRPLDQFAMLQTVVSTVNNIDHSLAAIVQEAADDDRFVLRQVDDRQPLPARFGLDAFSWDGRPMVSCDTNGTIGCLRVAMEMAGYLIGLRSVEIQDSHLV